MRSSPLVPLAAAQGMSRLGAELVMFALAIWCYQRTGTASASGFAVTASILPPLLLLPMAGVLADRIGWRAVLVAALTGGLACAVALTAILRDEAASVSVVLGVVAVAAACRAGENAAMALAPTSLVNGRDRDRGNAMLGLAIALPQVIAPALAGGMWDALGIELICLVCAALMAAALTAVAIGRYGRRAGHRAHDGADDDRGGDRDTDHSSGRRPGSLALAWRDLRDAPALLALLSLMVVVRFCVAAVVVLLTPLVLGLDDPHGAATVRVVAGLGMLAGGGAALGIQPPQRVRILLGASAVQAVGLLVMGMGRSVSVVAGATFAVSFTTPLLLSASESLWQEELPAERQGRGLALRTLVMGSAVLCALVVAGPAADHVGALLLGSDGALGAALRFAVGAGASRGPGLLIAFLGVGLVAAVVAARAEVASRRGLGAPP